jgi:hypothetical protein
MAFLSLLDAIETIFSLVLERTFSHFIILREIDLIILLDEEKASNWI